eukprot:TRINITY_DN46682_c0_g1_i1.p1 TRINITY_DN46682_c0_g1~~TRINITY_DN46682_c0_g1_i1.p1  ORF type:complete len:579 (-),score=82.41 TRINITY_DN46682_c0_g1_i1:139-1875(-)
MDNVKTRGYNSTPASAFGTFRKDRLSFDIVRSRHDVAAEARATTNLTIQDLERHRKRRGTVQMQKLDLHSQMRDLHKGSIIRPTLKWYPSLGLLLGESIQEEEELLELVEALEEAAEDAENAENAENGESGDLNMDPAAEAGFLQPGSVSATIINLASATMGLGSLSLPMATAKAGVVVSGSIIFVMYLVCCFTIHLISASLEARNAASFAELSVAVGGKPLGIVVELLSMSFCFGTMVSILLGAAKVIGIFLPGASMPCLIFYVALAVMPPLLVENVGALSSISCFSQLCLCYMSIIIVIYAFYLGLNESLFVPSGDDTSDPATSWNLELLKFCLADGDLMGYVRAMLVFVFAFANQTVIPCIYTELDGPSVQKMTKIGFITMGLVTLIYATVNFSGFFTWGVECSSNVLFDYKDYIVPKHGFLCVAVAGSLVAAWTCFPLNAFPCKFACVAIINCKFPSTSDNAWIARGVAVLLVTSAYISAIALPSLAVVLELVGATAGVAMMFFLPGGFYLALVPREKGHIYGPLYLHHLCWLLVAAGFVVGFFGLYSAVEDAFAMFQPQEHDSSRKVEHQRQL